MLKSSGWLRCAGTALVVVGSALAAPAAAFDLVPSAGASQSFVTTAGNPLDYVPQPGTDSVVLLQLAGSLCSGTLLETGAHILTAAHCLPSLTSGVVDFSAQATFQLATEAVSSSISQFFIPTEWDGGFFNGFDLAILELTEFAPATALRSEIYRANAELDQVVDIIGFGRSGDGDAGGVMSAGTKRRGQNRIDFALDSLLVYDFDNGLPENNVFGDLGLGALEVSAARGDSGGPLLIDNQIAGITSFGTGGSSADVDSVLNSSFGEVVYNTRVSAHTGWIDGILNDWRQAQAPEPESVSEPGFALSLLAVGGWFAWRRRR